MSSHWQPKNWEEACKRNAGRRKLHMRKREQRANRVLLLLTAMDASEALRESSDGALPAIAKSLGVSEATASRDLALCRRIHAQFVRLFGRLFKPDEDKIVWSWNWSHYGSRPLESENSGHRKPVGHFPFSTRYIAVDEEAYCGFNPLSCRHKFEERTFRYNGADFLAMMEAVERIGG